MNYIIQLWTLVGNINNFKMVVKRYKKNAINLEGISNKKKRANIIAT